MSGPQQAMSGNRLPPHGTHANPPGDLNLTDLVLQLREDIRGMREELDGLNERVTGSNRTVQGMVGRIVALEGIIREPRRGQADERPQHQRPLSPAAPRHPQPRAAPAGDGRGQYIDYDLDNFEEEIDENPRVPVARRFGRYDRRHDREFDEDERWAYRDRDQDIWNARLEAPSFDGSLEPQDYLDWEARMNRYFDWLGMSDPRRAFFAKTMLRGRALTYWTNLEERLAERFEEPIDTWDEMKARLREKYVPVTYHHRLIDRWQSISQGSRKVHKEAVDRSGFPDIRSSGLCGSVDSKKWICRQISTVSQYIDEFDDLLLRCGAREEGALTLSRFRRGLRRAYQQELFRQHVTTLDQAYQVVREMEQFEQEWESSRVRSTYQRPLDSRAAPSPTPRVPSSRVPEGQRPEEVPFALLPLRRDDRGKAPMRETTCPGDKFRDRCYHCQGLGHHAIDCPQRALAIGNGESFEQEQSLVDVDHEAPTSPSVAATPQVVAPSGDPSSSQPRATASAMAPLAGKPPPARTPKTSTLTTMTLQLITAREFEHELFDYDVIYALMWVTWRLLVRPAPKLEVTKVWLSTGTPSQQPEIHTVCCCRQASGLLSTGTHRTEIPVLETSPCRQQALACRQVLTVSFVTASVTDVGVDRDSEVAAAEGLDSPSF
ncbi:hypothetical protein Taro_037356 [Colocasia esculenta]|uniref:CCHC-type domain-containing protein n=1 Tax=Colocasia esculenta TaxID=4460 RepID=A0A843WG16_COLES|nr:hypothetical protein [Colocasia esculenta]